MSNQKVLPSVITDDNQDHSNKINIPFKKGVCNACAEIEKNTNKPIGKKENLNLINSWKNTDPEMVLMIVLYQDLEAKILFFRHRY